MKWTLPVLVAACLTLTAGLRELAGGPVSELLAFGALPAVHHPIGEVYDEERTIVLDGQVEAFLFGNPHSLLHVRVIDESGSDRTWAVEWRAADRLSRAGVRGDALARGDAVTLCGHPGRDPAAYRGGVDVLERAVLDLIGGDEQLVDDLWAHDRPIVPQRGAHAGTRRSRPSATMALRSSSRVRM